MFRGREEGDSWRFAAALAVGVIVLGLSACVTESTPLTTSSPSQAELVAASRPTTTAVPPLPDIGPIRTEFEAFDHDNFDNPTVIDNEWLPLLPGTQLTSEGTTNEDGDLTEHQVISIATDLTKVIDGINTVVVWDRDYSDGELAETELAFFAQDNDGNVWRMGEHPEEYENRALVDAPTWLAGLGGAYAGISMLGDPREGTISYSQGWSPAVEFADRGIVGAIGQATCVPTGCYEGVLVVHEFNVDEPGALQHKYFASGVGNVRVDWSGTDETREELELVSDVVLTPAEMEDVRVAVLELEAHAYEISPDLYGLTDPIEDRVDAEE